MREKGEKAHMLGEEEKGDGVFLSKKKMFKKIFYSKLTSWENKLNLNY